jgi:mannose-1-phosphate guanylyltransferase
VPKQYCAILGRDTLLQMTLRRVARAADPARIQTIVTRTHERFFSPLVAEFPHLPLIIQPANRGTAAAIAYAVFRIAELCPSAAIAVFPSDHWFGDDAGFMRNVEYAFELIAQFQDTTIALGLGAERPEGGYGWFELGERLAALPVPLFNMRGFHEKPTPTVTRALWEKGARRNSFVLVATASALLNLILETVPELYFAFHSIYPTLGTTFEEKTVEALYRDLPVLDFSRHVLAASRKNVAVLPVDGIEWSDLGEPRRVMAVRKDLGYGGRLPVIVR